MMGPALLLTTLLGTQPIDWQPTVAGRKVPVAAAVQVLLPPDWLYGALPHGIVASRDGPLLENVSVTLVEHKEAFAAANRRCGPDVPPEDLAESYVANLQTGSDALESVTVLETEPAELAGHAAFRVHLRYRAPASEGGAQMERIAFGTALPAGFLLFSYSAPALHYFAQWQAAFEQIVQGARPR